MDKYRNESADQASHSAPQAPADAGDGTPPPRRRRLRRTLLRITGGLVAALLVLGCATYLARDRIIDAVIRNQLSAEPDPSFLADDGRIRVLLCGTGTPEVTDAAQACTLVAAGGQMFLFDAGEGAAQSLNRSSVDLGRVDNVFLTHFHSDHFNGLGTLINQRWTWGGKTRVQVTGPPGVEELVDGITTTYRIDNGFRALDMPPLAATVEAATADAAPVMVPEGDSVRVYNDNGVTIDAVRVEHDPVDPAYGYILTHAGKKVFISGDTVVSEATLSAMRDADLVVHEAYATHMAERAFPIMRELGKDNDADVAELTLEYHADTMDLARQAQDAGVKRLALTHLIPYPNNFLQRRMFVSGMGDEFDGEVILGKDGTVIVV